MRIDSTKNKNTKIEPGLLTKSVIDMYKELIELYSEWLHEFRIKATDRIDTRMEVLTTALESHGLTCKNCHYCMHCPDGKYYCMYAYGDGDFDGDYDGLLICYGARLSTEDLVTLGSCLRLNLEGYKVRSDPYKDFQLF